MYSKARNSGRVYAIRDPSLAGSKRILEHASSNFYNHPKNWWEKTRRVVLTAGMLALPAASGLAALLGGPVLASQDKQQTAQQEQSLEEKIRQKLEQNPELKKKYEKTVRKANEAYTNWKKDPRPGPKGHAVDAWPAYVFYKQAARIARQTGSESPYKKRMRELASFITNAYAQEIIGAKTLAEQKRIAETLKHYLGDLSKDQQERLKEKLKKFPEVVNEIYGKQEQTPQPEEDDEERGGEEPRVKARPPETKKPSKNSIGLQARIARKGSTELDNFQAKISLGSFLDALAVHDSEKTRDQSGNKTSENVLGATLDWNGKTWFVNGITASYAAGTRKTDRNDVSITKDPVSRTTTTTSLDEQGNISFLALKPKLLIAKNTRGFLNFYERADKTSINGTITTQFEDLTGGGGDFTRVTPINQSFGVKTKGLELEVQHAINSLINASARLGYEEIKNGLDDSKTRVRRADVHWNYKKDWLLDGVIGFRDVNAPGNANDDIEAHWRMFFAGNLSDNVLGFAELTRLDQPEFSLGTIVGNPKLVDNLATYRTFLSDAQLDRHKHLSPELQEALVDQARRDFRQLLSNTDKTAFYVSIGRRRVERGGSENWKFIGEAALAIPTKKLSITPYVVVEESTLKKIFEAGITLSAPNKNWGVYLSGGKHLFEGPTQPLNDDTSFFVIGGWFW